MLTSWPEGRVFLFCRVGRTLLSDAFDFDSTRPSTQVRDDFNPQSGPTSRKSCEKWGTLVPSFQGYSLTVFPLLAAS